MGHESTIATVIRYWGIRLVGFSALLIVVATLYPFRFNLGELGMIQEAFRQGARRVGKLDAVMNVILFIPYGFGIGALFSQRKLSLGTRVAIALLPSLVLSGSVEILQTLLPSRISSISDLITNTLGGGLGYGLFHLAGGPVFQVVDRLSQIQQRFTAKWSLKPLHIAFWAYAVVAIAVTLGLYSTSLSNWRLDYPLVIGGGQGQQAYWDGVVEQLQLSDRVLSAAEFEEAKAKPMEYRLPGAIAGFPDRLGLPSMGLEWKGNAPKDQPVQGPRVNDDHWLETPGAVTAINQAIQKSSQFTLTATLATRNPQAKHYAYSILSIADDEYFGLGNITLSQLGPNLIGAVRTSVQKGDRGIYQFMIPGVFETMNARHIVMSYSRFTMRVWVDGLPYVRIVEMVSGHQPVLQGLMVFAPLGLILSAIAARTYRRWEWMGLGLCLVIPPMVLEVLIASQSYRGIRVANILLGFLILAGMVAAFWAPRRSRKKDESAVNLGHSEV